MNQVKVTDNNRFELEVRDVTVFIELDKIEPNILDLLHSKVPKSHSGQGLGSVLVKGALNYCRENGLIVIPTCPFIKSYMDENPQWNDLIANQ
jgi:predicted GNAT family acetyltransferase